jgi:DNA-binding transcriptional ArsR family regulator
VYRWQLTVRELDLPAAVNNVAAWLSTYPGADGAPARPGLPEMVRATGLDRETITRALRALTAAGLVRQESRGGGRGHGAKAAEYTLTFPDVPAKDTEQAIREAFRRKRAGPADVIPAPLDRGWPGQPRSNGRADHRPNSGSIDCGLSSNQLPGIHVGRANLKARS